MSVEQNKDFNESTFEKMAIVKFKEKLISSIVLEILDISRSYFAS